MAIYGVGAYYDHDVSDDFIAHGIVGTGWSPMEAPELHEYFRSMKVGDIVYLKSAFGGADVTVKAIGIISDTTIRTSTDPGTLVSVGRNVKWLSRDKFVIGRPVEKNNIRSNTVYEEFHPIVQHAIISKIVKT